jgi:hypothetical protein
MEYYYRNFLIIENNIVDTQNWQKPTPGRLVKPGPCRRFDRVSCSRSSTKALGGLTVPQGRSNRVTPISGRIRSLA